MTHTLPPRVSGRAAAAASRGLRPALAWAEDAAKFKLGIVTYNVPKDWDLPTLLKVCKEVGIAAVECRTTHKHGVEPTLTADQRKDVKKQFADAGVVFWGCGSVCEFHSADPAVVKKNIEDCKQFVELVKDLGGKGVKVRPNGVPKGADEQKTFEQIGKALVECGKAAADAGVEIWVEVHGGGHADPEEHEDHHGACGHKAVGVTWNSNAADVENKSVADGVRAAEAVDQVVPHQRPGERREGQVPVPRAVQAAPRHRATTATRSRGRQGVPRRRRGHRVPEEVQGALGASW